MGIGDVDLFTYHIWIGDMCIGGFLKLGSWYLKPWKKRVSIIIYISSKIKAKNLCCWSFPDMAAMWASRGKQNTGKNLFSSHLETKMTFLVFVPFQSFGVNFLCKSCAVSFSLDFLSSAFMGFHLLENVF